jgi:integrase
MQPYFSDVVQSSSASCSCPNCMDHVFNARSRREPWNKGKLVRQKAPLRLKDIWAIRIRLQPANRTRELALFNLAIDSKLRSCDLVKLRLRDVAHGNRITPRAIVMQQKTQRPVQTEITEPTRGSLMTWTSTSGLTGDCFLFPSRLHASAHLSTRQYARIVKRLGPGDWVGSWCLRHAYPAAHKAPLIYRRTKNPGAVQLLLGHSKLESTVRYLGIEVDDALEMADQMEA